MNDYTIYWPNGEIVSSERTNVYPSNYLQENQLVIEAESEPVRDYVDVSQTPHTIKSRPEFPIYLDKYEVVSDGLDKITISNIPTGTKIIETNGNSHIIKDGVLEFSVDLPGQYNFMFLNSLYLKKVITIEAISTT